MALSSNYIYLESDNILTLTGLAISDTSEYINNANISVSVCDKIAISLTAGAVIDVGDGDVTLLSTAHGLSTGDNIRIVGTKNYDGEYTITSIAADSFNITATYVAETLTGNEKAYKVVPNGFQLSMNYVNGSNGNYLCALPETLVLYENSSYYIFIDIENSLGTLQLLVRKEYQAIFKN